MNAWLSPGNRVRAWMLLVRKTPKPTLSWLITTVLDPMSMVSTGVAGLAAAIVAVPGTTPTMEEIKKYCSDKLAKYKIPESIIFVASLTGAAIGIGIVESATRILAEMATFESANVSDREGATVA